MLSRAAFVVGLAAACIAATAMARESAKPPPDQRPKTLTPGAWNTTDYSPMLTPGMALKYQSGIVCATSAALRAGAIPIMPPVQARTCQNSTRMVRGLNTIIAKCPDGMHVLRPDYLVDDLLIGMYMFKSSDVDGLELNAGLEMQKLASDCPTAPAEHVRFEPPLPGPFARIGAGLDAIAANDVAGAPLYRLLQAAMRGVFEDQSLPLQLRRVFSAAASSLAAAPDDRRRLAILAAAFRDRPAQEQTAAVAAAALAGVLRDIDPRGVYLPQGAPRLEDPPTPARAELLDGGIGYLRPAAFGPTTAVDLRTAIGPLSEGRLRGLILDLRGNNSAQMDATVMIASDFLPPGAPVVFVKRRSGSTASPLTAAPGDRVAEIPLVAIVDGRTAGGAEVIAAALQDAHRAVIVGSRTSGDGRSRPSCHSPSAMARCGSRRRR